MLPQKSVRVGDVVNLPFRVTEIHEGGLTVRFQSTLPNGTIAFGPVGPTIYGVVNWDVVKRPVQQGDKVRFAKDCGIPNDQYWTGVVVGQDPDNQFWIIRKTKYDPGELQEYVARPDDCVWYEPTAQ
jgi:hypothetical protein